MQCPHCAKSFTITDLKKSPTQPDEQKKILKKERIALMQGCWGVAVPDFVVHKINTSDRKNRYPIQFEICNPYSKSIEVFNKKLFPAIEKTADYWEELIKKETGLSGIDIYIYRFHK